MPGRRSRSQRITALRLTEKERRPSSAYAFENGGSHYDFVPSSFSPGDCYPRGLCNADETLRVVASSTTADGLCWASWAEGGACPGTPGTLPQFPHLLPPGWSSHAKIHTTHGGCKCSRKLRDRHQVRTDNSQIHSPEDLADSCRYAPHPHSHIAFLSLLRNNLFVLSITRFSAWALCVGEKTPRGHDLRSC